LYLGEIIQSLLGGRSEANIPNAFVSGIGVIISVIRNIYFRQICCRRRSVNNLGSKCMCCIIREVNSGNSYLLFSIQVFKCPISDSIIYPILIFFKTIMKKNSGSLTANNVDVKRENTSKILLSIILLF
jgi:hypothetical protein